MGDFLLPACTHANTYRQLRLGFAPDFAGQAMRYLTHNFKRETCESFILAMFERKNCKYPDIKSSARMCESLALHR
ncbi:MAG: hypothetical protein BMS9Abin13_374 [Patescibacteria group bacterium]|nr:MAG: hypothetical protein BMS9Abin13_374 [Patescibacteria group bacterium]